MARIAELERGAAVLVDEASSREGCCRPRRVRPQGKKRDTPGKFLYEAWCPMRNGDA